MARKATKNKVVEEQLQLDLEVPEVEPEVEPEVKEQEERNEEQLQLDLDVVKSGIVTSCFSLNIRKEASIESEVIGVIKESEELEINLTESTDEFYSVVTYDGLVGYCMKKYIVIK